MAPGVPHRSSTLALRIQFHGRDALKVLDTSQDSIQSLLPLIRKALTSLRLPHPKTTNVIKPDDAASFIDMYWDVVTVKVRSRVLLYPPFNTDSRWPRTRGSSNYCSR